MLLSILIADDSALSRKLVIRALPAGSVCEVRQATNGLEAVEACRVQPPDLLCLDLTMPVMDGFQVLEILQKEGFRIPIIVLSADIQPRAQERVTCLGARAFLKKPVDPVELARVLQNCGWSANDRMEG